MFQETQTYVWKNHHLLIQISSSRISGDLPAMALSYKRGDYRNYYEGHTDKIKREGGGGGGRGVRLGWGGGMGRKDTQL